MSDAKRTLAWLKSRRTVRAYVDRPVAGEVLIRVLEAATSAPSNTNRQPWRFTVVTTPKKKAALIAVVRERIEQLKAIIARGHHAQDFGGYGEMFYEPLEAAAAIIVPQYRVYPDLIAGFIRSGGGDPAAFHTGEQMQAELASASAAVMALVLQAHAEGLGACWMTGPLLARDEVSALLGIREPWKMLCAVALGWPVGPEAPRPRKPLERVVEWIEDEQEK